MKVSINHIRYYQKQYGWSADPMPDGIAALAQKIGAQLGGIDEITDVGAKYSNALVVKVVSVANHPEADRLHVCMVDDGSKTEGIERDSQGLVQVVCGAPNVHAEMLAVWLPPGATVPSTYGKEPFVMEARVIRGQKSNGMLASPKELAIGDLHEGILEIDEDVASGTPFAEHYGLAGDYVLDIENKMFTHRPDCFGMMGVAREIAGIQGQTFKSPDWYVQNPQLPVVETGELRLEVKNELPELVRRFTAITMSGVRVKPSPIWLQARLSRLGLRPINNIVDLTNYYMILTGQPLHAYDYDKVKAQDSGADYATLVVRYPKEGEKITLLNGKTIEPRAETIMIATRDKLIGVGGVMGGGDTEVDEHTKNIVLECANFDMYSIRRTSMAHGLFTDAVARFNKGQSPLQNLAVLGKITEQVRELAGGKVASAVIDDNHVQHDVLARGSVHASVSVSVGFINARLGLFLNAEEMAKLLRNVEFEVSTNDGSLAVKPPFWRTDVEISEDVVEEIGRLYGYDKLPLELPKRDLAPVLKDRLLELKQTIRDSLAKAGANEVLTYSFVHGNLLDKVGQDRSKAFQLANALSPDLQYYRLSLLPSLLEKIHPNIKTGYDSFALFEMGKAHDKSAVDDDGLPIGFDNLALVYTEGKSTKSGAPYYEARVFLMALMRTFGVELKFAPFTQHAQPMDSPFEFGRAALIEAVGAEQAFGIVGEFRASVRKALKLPDFTAGFELGAGALLGYRRFASSYRSLPRFPKVEQDICLKVAAEMPYQQVLDFVTAQLSEHHAKDMRSSLSPIDIYQRPDDASHKQVTLRLAVASYDRTLTDAEVARILERVGDAAATELHAERI